MSEISSAVANVLVAAATGLVVLMAGRAWWLARRRQIIISDLVDATGGHKLEECCRELNAALAHRVAFELLAVKETVLKYHELSQHNEAERPYALEMPRGPVLRGRQQHGLETYLKMLETGVPDKLVWPLEVVKLAGNPRGIRVTPAVEHRREETRDRLGITVELADLAEGPFATGNFREPRSEPDNPSPEDRLAALVEPVGWWIAVELTGRELSRGGLRKQQKQQRKGLRENVVGLLYHRHRNAFPGHEEAFLRLAVDHFQQATLLIPREYAPYRNLGVAYRDLADRQSGMERALALARAVESYQKALDASETTASGAVREMIRCHLQVRLALAQIGSGLELFRERALEWLTQNDPAQWILGRSDAALLYTAACLYATAERESPGSGWDDQARRLLGAALVRDAERALWQGALLDPDLCTLRTNLDQFQVEVAVRLSEGAHGRLLDCEGISEIVAGCADRAGWRPVHPPTSEVGTTT